MTTNEALSTPYELKRDRPEDYRDHVVTTEWPLGPSGEPFRLAARLAARSSSRTVKTSVPQRASSVSRGPRLAPPLSRLLGRTLMPPLPALLDAPFWLDPSDRHRMAAAMQVASRPLAHDYAAAWATGATIWFGKQNLAEAIHRVAAEGISPEQVVDEAIARIKRSSPSRRRDDRSQRWPRLVGAGGSRLPPAQGAPAGRSEGWNPAASEPSKGPGAASWARGWLCRPRS